LAAGLCLGLAVVPAPAMAVEPELVVEPAFDGNVPLLLLVEVELGLAVVPTPAATAKLVLIELATDGNVSAAAAAAVTAVER